MNEALTQQMLEWLERSPRSYDEVMDAWRTSCPRLSIWEDALAGGLLEIVRSNEGSAVRLTERGRSWLAERPES
ncbi:MAG TPA: hypothetical protein PLX06_11935 [Fimbriimonadaceae bacterium]|nr:hypothetical protein [Fimbriimonadaceae bacterium]